nr:MAG TPA: hypothetical protein [Bacteriophage sp.]
MLGTFFIMRLSEPLSEISKTSSALSAYETY